MRSWTATVTRRRTWVAVDVSVIAVSVFVGLYVSSLVTNVPFDIKFTPLKFSVLLIVQICCLIATSAIYSKAFRRWQTIRGDMTSIGSGVALAMICVIFLFLVFQTTYKPIMSILSDAVAPCLFVWVFLSATRAVERTYMHLFYRRTTAVFAGVEPIWRDALAEARAMLSDDWRLVISSDRQESQTDWPDGIEVWEEADLSSWLTESPRRNEKTLFVFSDRQSKRPMNEALIVHAYSNAIPTTNITDFYEELLEKTPLFEQGETWYCQTGLPRPRPLDLWIKRGLDLLIAVPLLFLTLPVTGILAIAIRLESHGAAIFRQPRVGLGGRVFTLYKLRTMTLHDDDSDIWPNFEAQKVTKSGEILRRTGLDELPQLFNVIKGDMSFIGPRPARPKVTQRHIDRLPYYAVVKSVKPGISGWAQLHQGQDAGDRTMFEKTRFNLYYAERFSIWLDILIYIRTFSQLINGRKRESVYMNEHLAPSEGGGGRAEHLQSDENAVVGKHGVEPLSADRYRNIQ